MSPVQRVSCRYSKDVSRPFEVKDMTTAQKCSAAFPSVSRKGTVNPCFILPSKSIWGSLWALMYQMKGVSEVLTLVT